MALTFKGGPNGAPEVWGKTEIRFYVATPAASDYTTGGYTLTPGQGISLKIIYYVIPLGGQAGYVPVWNTTTGKLQIYQQSAATGPLTEVPASTNLSAESFSLLLIGN